MDSVQNYVGEIILICQLCFMLFHQSILLGDEKWSSLLVQQSQVLVQVSDMTYYVLSISSELMYGYRTQKKPIGLTEHSYKQFLTYFLLNKRSRNYDKYNLVLFSVLVI